MNDKVITLGLLLAVVAGFFMFREQPMLAVTLALWAIIIKYALAVLSKGGY